MDGMFDLLRMRLLLQRLNDEPNSALHLRIIREAESAAAQAARTPYPGLIFPCLFEECVRLAAEQHRQRSSAYWGDLAESATRNQIVTNPTPACNERP
jgi:hypothetical protein